MYLKLEIGLYKNMLNAPKDLEVFEKSWMINNCHLIKEPNHEVLSIRIWNDYLKYQSLLIETKKPVDIEPKSHISQLHVFEKDYIEIKKQQQ